MVDLSSRLAQIKVMVDHGDYFTMNRARQYGKTTILNALTAYLKDDYVVVSLDFQYMGSDDFATEEDFARAFAEDFYAAVHHDEKIPENCKDSLKQLANGGFSKITIRKLFAILEECCAQSQKGIVLLIDEVDTASNFDVFLDFLAQLRVRYMNREERPAFQSVILASMHDIRNIKQKIRSESEKRANSPWNIAVEFNVDMSFSPEDIAGMLQEYEADYQTGMDISSISHLIYDYTSGYPFLVSDICQLLDEIIAETTDFPNRKAAWTVEGVLAAVQRILDENNALFQSLTAELEADKQLEQLLYEMLMNGKEISYVPGYEPIENAIMYGFVKVENGTAVIANRIFETHLYNSFLLSSSGMSSEMYNFGSRDKYQFIKDGQLDMRLILERFVLTFDELYGDRPEKFKEDDGRRYFLLFLRPIINGNGNYYIEAQTRNQERTDVIVDYCGNQYVIELKIWRGESYNTRGEEQLCHYLDYYHLETGYMLSFCFNKNKGKPRVQEVPLGERRLIEAVV